MKEKFALTAPKVLFGQGASDKLLGALFFGKIQRMRGTKTSRAFGSAFDLAHLARLLGPQSFRFQTVQKYISTQFLNSYHEPKVARELKEIATNSKSLVIPNFHFLDANALWISEMISRWIGCPVKINLFVTPSGEQALPVHSDGHDILIFQIQGKKKWSIYNSKILESAVSGARVFARPGTPEFQTVLSSGNFLFLPKGTAHSAVAIKSFSMHMTVGFHPLGMNEFLSAIPTQASREKNLKHLRGIFGPRPGFGSARVSTRGSAFVDLQRISNSRTQSHFRNAYSRSLKIPKIPDDWKAFAPRDDGSGLFLSQARFFNFRSGPKGKMFLSGQGEEMVVTPLLQQAVTSLASAFLVDFFELQKLLPSKHEREQFLKFCRKTNFLIPLDSRFPLKRLQKMLDSLPGLS